jgi:hypothetical protein
MIYTAPHNAFDAGKSITRASERGLVPGNRDFFGPCEMASSRQVFHLGPKKDELSRAQPHPTCPSNGFARIKTIIEVNR